MYLFLTRRDYDEIRHVPRLSDGGQLCIGTWHATMPKEVPSKTRGVSERIKAAAESDVVNNGKKSERGQGTNGVIGKTCAWHGEASESKLREKRDGMELMWHCNTRSTTGTDDVKLLSFGRTRPFFCMSDESFLGLILRA